MPIMNYTTKIDVFKSIGEIQSDLAKHGAKKIMQEYGDNGEPIAISFSIITPVGERDSFFRQTAKQFTRCCKNKRSNVICHRLTE